MSRTHLRNLSLAELRQFVLDHGEPEYRYRQLATWLYARLETRFEHMTDLSREYRRHLEEDSTVSALRAAVVQESAVDGTRKFLFELADGAKVESVLMRYETRTTLCAIPTEARRSRWRGCSVSAWCDLESAVIVIGLSPCP
jgi:23S rRNA (adenine2503-C2)-methyltransferase